MMSHTELPPPPSRYPTVPWSTLMGRALRLKCPRCGEGAIFSGPFTTLDHCSHCKLKYERAPGYFLGSIYINYGLTAWAITISLTDASMESVPGGRAARQPAAAQPAAPVGGVASAEKARPVLGWAPYFGTFMRRPRTTW